MTSLGWQRVFRRSAWLIGWILPNLKQTPVAGGEVLEGVLQCAAAASSPGSLINNLNIGGKGNEEDNELDEEKVVA